MMPAGHSPQKKSGFNFFKTEKSHPLVKADGKAWDSRQLHTRGDPGIEKLMILNSFSPLEWMHPL